MGGPELTCPSCGAPIPPEHRFDEEYVCEYCGNVCYFAGSGGLRGTATEADLADLYTRFRLGQEGSIRGKVSFRVVGRVVYDYGDGYWSEWVLSGPDGYAYLHEDEGIYVLLRPRPLEEPVPSRDSFRRGAFFDWQRMPRWYVTEVRTARVMAVEGEVPNPPAVGEEVFYVDGLAAGKVASLEVPVSDPSRAEVTFGVPLEYEEIWLEGEPRWQ